MVGEVIIQASIPFWDRLRGGGWQAHCLQRASPVPSTVATMGSFLSHCYLFPSSQQVSELRCPGKSQLLRGGGAVWSFHSSDPRTCPRGSATPRVAQCPQALFCHFVYDWQGARQCQLLGTLSPKFSPCPSVGSRHQDLPCIFPDGYGEQGKKDFEENRGQAVTSPEL